MAWPVSIDNIDFSAPSSRLSAFPFRRDVLYVSASLGRSLNDQRTPPPPPPPPPPTTTTTTTTDRKSVV